MRRFLSYLTLWLFIASVFCTEAYTSIEQHRVLCADVGGSRIKAAILHTGITLEELKTIRTVAIDAKPWSNKEFAQVLNPSIPGNLIQELGEDFDEVSIGFRGPIMFGRFCVVSKDNFPYRLKHLCHETTKRPVFVECDMGVWSRGILYWHDLIKEDIRFPCLCITLGTGIGVSIVNSQEDITNVEISVIDSPFKRLFNSAGEQPIITEYNRLAPHDVLGTPFFNWIKRENLFSDEHALKIEYNKRMAAFLRDMKDYLRTLDVNVNTIVIAGGNSRFVNAHEMHQKTGKNITLLSPYNISQYGVPPDVIPLLGCLMLPMYQPVKVIPAWEEMIAWYDP